MKKLFCLVIFAFSVAFATHTVAVLPSDGTLGNDENELLTDKMREAALKSLPVNKYTLLKQDVVIKRLGGMENYIKECSETSCIVSLGKKAQVDYVAQCRVGKLGNRLRITVELYEVNTGGLLGMFSDIVDDFDKLPALMDKNVPDVFRNITVRDQESSASPAVPLVKPAAPVAHLPATDGSWLNWGEGKTGDLENAVDIELGYKEPEKKIDPKVEKESSKSFWAALALDVVGLALVYYGYTMDKEAVSKYDDYVSLGNNATKSEFDSAWTKVDDAKSNRTGSYAIGSLLLASGIAVHIWF